MLRFLTAGESHGPMLTGILEGMPPGVKVSLEELKVEQARRRWCYGRGGRASIEKDEIRITGGVQHGITTGAPISVVIPNRDYENWANTHRPITSPRPGHADFAGAVKYGFRDARAVAERSSARETAVRVACGYFARCLLREVGVQVVSWVTSIGNETADLGSRSRRLSDPMYAEELGILARQSDVRCPDPDASCKMIQCIERAREQGTSLGGVFEVAALDVPCGLGSYVHWDRRLDSRLAAQIMSIPGVKAVEIGAGFDLARMQGYEAQDEFIRSEHRVSRCTNMAGGIEGGVSNGEMILASAAVKPVPTQSKPLRSVDMVTGEEAPAHLERTDVCVVGSTAVVAESLVCLVLADEWLRRHGQDGCGISARCGR